MKFIVNSSYLLKQLSHINGVITTNPVVPILENFLFEIDKSKLTVTASDLQTSMITEINVESKEKGNIAVPAKILLETLKNLPDQPVTFSIDESTYSIEISSDNGRYKLAGENATDFPKVPAVSNDFSANISTEVLARPTTNPIKMTISRTELLGSLKRISIYANKTTHQVRLKITGSELQVSAEDLDFSNEANERLSCEHEGEDIEIGFNARFLIEMLSNLDTDQIKLNMSAANKAGVIFPAEKEKGEDILMLVMPVMLNQYA